jgi:tRNA threonylcarbamoyladenosine biosynthesis protein TsaB
MSFYLALDTATDACSVATCVDGEIRERYEVLQREHTQKLLPMIQAALADCGRTVAQLDGLACGIGPGSFAGLRIGVGVIKGLALGRGLPVVGVSSLAMLAQRALDAGSSSRVAACLDARLNEVYFGAYERGPDGLARAVLEDRACPPDAVPALPAGEWLGVGNGWAVVAVKPATVDALALPHAADALRLALPQFAAGRTISGDDLAPAYLREHVALTLEQQARRRQEKT